MVFIFFPENEVRYERIWRDKKVVFLAASSEKNIKFLKTSVAYIFFVNIIRETAPRDATGTHNYLLVCANLASYYNEQHCQISTKSAKGSLRY